MSKSMNIQVVARVRACFEPSEDYPEFHQNEIGDNGIRIEVAPGTKFGWLTNPKPHYEFNFSGLFWKDSKQDRIFQDVAVPLISHSLEGFNATLFAYGQTGSGKTYTLSGGDNYDDRGIIPRSISYIYQKVRNDTQHQYNIKLSYIEIYNNIAYDLLSTSDETRDRTLDKLKKVLIVDNTGDKPAKGTGSVILYHEEIDSVNKTDNKNSIFQNHSEPIYQCPDDESAFMLLFQGETNRAIAATQSNDVSSRSHCILTLHLTITDSSGTIKSSKLNFVDLAGSERTENLGDEQNRIREARYINQSLFYLHNVIEKLNAKSDFIPYRDSKMTLFLKDSLGGNCMTTMIATLSSKTSHIHESISTCKFAMSVMTIKNNATVNLSDDPQVTIQRLRKEIMRLKNELAIERGEVNEEPISLEEADRLKEYVKNYMSGKNEMPSLSKKRVEFCWDYVRAHGFSDKEGQIGDGGDEKGETNDDGKQEGSKVMTDSELRRAAQKLAKKLQRREAEISVLVNMLNQSKSRLNAYVQTNIGDDNEDNNDEEEETQQQVVQTVPENPQEKAEAWKKFMLSHPKYPALISNQKTLESKITSAKAISAKAKQVKAAVEENKGKLKERFAEIEGKDTESDPVMMELTNKIYADTNQYTKMVNDLTSLKHEVQTIQKLIQQIKKIIKSDFSDFWMNHLKPSSSLKQSVPTVKVEHATVSSESSVSISSSVSSENANLQNSARRPKSRNSSTASIQKDGLQQPTKVDDDIVIQSTGDERADELIKQFEQKKKQYLSGKMAKSSQKQPPQ